MPMRPLKSRLWLLLLPAAASSDVEAPVKVAETDVLQDEAAAEHRHLAEATTGEDYSFPMCGFSRIDLTEDPVRRHCFRQCRIEPNGMIRPTFSEWEDYCRETAGMDLWDGECENYLACTFGCEVWGGDRERFTKLAPPERYEFLLESKADMYASGITQEQRCVLEKCHAYCARMALDSCRESQFREMCLAGNPQLYDCDVDCSSAERIRHVGAVAVALVLALLRAMAR